MLPDLRAHHESLKHDAESVQRVVAPDQRPVADLVRPTKPLVGGVHRLTRSGIDFMRSVLGS